MQGANPANRRRFLAGTATLVATATAGCTGTAFRPGSGEGAGDPDPTGNGRLVEVSAGGEASADPDRARARLGVEAAGETAEAVRTELATDGEQLRAALSDLVPERNVRTAGYRIGERRQGTGFEGYHSYAVEIEDVDRVGEVIDRAVEAGADDVGRVGFALAPDTREELREEALADALASADREAEAIAADRGADIVETAWVSTAGGGRPVEDPIPEAATDAARAPTALETEPVSVSVSVTVGYRLE
ncbi:SIMPL domain-containing protein [Saliphagus infecundisoli]|uniref:SIMPL domain-containing protein n=1 Tax=Saliphagus infecundisoli TaxID=1849069 RepID=A0ABD5QEI0_9EURY|nr:SIMPL domain-containing protein [Saliphagus infecundisoli]